MNELIIKKCLKCGAIIKEIKDCQCKDSEIMCCNEKMVELKVNSTDGIAEKHLPSFEIEDNLIKVSVNHVMEEEHFIEWICFKTENKEEFVYLKPGESAMAAFKKEKHGILYAYCNKHGLWKTKI